MNCGYHDIIERLGAPKWFDEEAVPRYCEFHPDEAANIYANQVALVEIACQNCGFLFDVAFSQAINFDMHTGNVIPWLAESVRDGSIHYGDPPNYFGHNHEPQCCHAGATMNCLDLRVKEFWAKGQGHPNRDNMVERDPRGYTVVKKEYFHEYTTWVRIPELEVVLPDGIEQA